MNSQSAPNVLIVEDEADFRDLLECEFASKGFNVNTASDGQAALYTLSRQNVSVVIADIRMPNMDGLTLLQRVKEKDAANPVFVFVSAYANIETEEAMSAGAEALFKKPFRLADLVLEVRRLMLPPAERWSTPQDAQAHRKIILKMSSLKTVSKGDVLGIGRGGMCFKWHDSTLALSQHVDFEVEVQSGVPKRFSGSGVIQWLRPAASIPEETVYGLEFGFIHDECRDVLVDLLNTHPPKAFIPAI